MQFLLSFLHLQLQLLQFSLRLGFVEVVLTLSKELLL